MPKISSIGKYLFKLQLKMSGVFFLRHTVDVTSAQVKYEIERVKNLNCIGNLMLL